MAQKATEVFTRTARHVEGTEVCMVTLPCRYKDKQVQITVTEA